MPLTQLLQVGKSELQIFLILFWVFPILGWLGYSNEKMIDLCEKYQAKGFTAFKIKIGQDVNRDIERCKLMRDLIGYTNVLMLDSNQIFDVQQAIDWVKQLKDFKPLWIEEPTSPDDVLGHVTIAKALKYNFEV